MLKNNKGITLVALVITIIVLLILAGVSISLVVGDNGVLTQAQGASRKTDVASANSAMELALSSISTEFMGETWTNNVNAKIYDNITIERLKSELKENGFARVTTREVYVLVKNVSGTVTEEVLAQSAAATALGGEAVDTTNATTVATSTAIGALGTASKDTVNLVTSGNIPVTVKTAPATTTATGKTTTYSYYEAILVTIQEDAKAKNTDTSYTYLVRANSDGTRISATNVTAADSSYGINNATAPIIADALITAANPADPT